MTYSERIQNLAGMISVIGVVSMPLSWVPIIAAGGIVLEVPNVVSVLFLLLLPLAILNSRRMWRINLLFGLMFIWSMLYMGSMLMHHTAVGVGLLRLQVMQAAFGWTLALAIAHSNIRASRLGLWGLIAILLALVVSSSMSHVNLGEAFTDYLVTGNRDRFIYHGMRTIFNAFTFRLSDFDYVASQVNNLANAAVLYAAMVFMSDGGKGTSLPAKAFALLFIAAAFVMFSTSANLVIFVILLCLAYRAMTRSPALFRISFPLILLALLIVAYEPLMAFLESNLAEDTKSRGARLGQYHYAFGVISDHLWSGIGYFEFGGFSIHNWALFSWSTTGYFAFITVILIYLLLFTSGAKYILLVRDNTHVIIPLMAMMLVRTSVGGGGGIPSGSAIAATAVVVGLLERHLRLARQSAPDPAPDHGPVPAPVWKTGYPLSA